MRCRACDRRLNDYESTRKSSNTGDYIDLCNRCFATISDDIATTDVFQEFEDEPVDEGYKPTEMGDGGFGDMDSETHIRYSDDESY